MEIKSLSARRVWIEIYLEKNFVNDSMSLSARRVWIEIGYGGGVDDVHLVTLLGGGVG